MEEGIQSEEEESPELMVERHLQQEVVESLMWEEG